MSARGGHCLLLWKSPSMGHIPVCSAVSLIPLLAIPAVLSHQRRIVWRLSKFFRQDQIQKAWSCWPLPQSPRSAASQLVLWLPTKGQLRRGRPVSTFIDTLMRDAGTPSTGELSACKKNKADWAAQGD